MERPSEVVGGRAAADRPGVTAVVTCCTPFGDGVPGARSRPRNGHTSGGVTSSLAGRWRGTTGDPIRRRCPSPNLPRRRVALSTAACRLATGTRECVQDLGEHWDVRSRHRLRTARGWGRYRFRRYSAHQCHGRLPSTGQSLIALTSQAHRSLACGLAPSWSQRDPGPMAPTGPVPANSRSWPLPAVGNLTRVHLSLPCRAMCLPGLLAADLADRPRLRARRRIRKASLGPVEQLRAEDGRLQGVAVGRIERVEPGEGLDPVEAVGHGPHREVEPGCGCGRHAAAVEVRRQGLHSGPAPPRAWRSGCRTE